MRIVRVDHLRAVLAQHPRQLPRCGQVDLVERCETDEIHAFGRPRVQLALRMRDEHRPVPALAQSEDGQERLLLPASPGAGGVDVEAEHSSQSLASFRNTEYEFTIGGA